MNFVLDLPNFLACVLIVVVARSVGLLSLRDSIILFLSCVIPFVLNDVLFPWSYQPDQRGYWLAVQAIRDWDFDRIPVDQPAVTWAGIMLSILPMPSVLTISSLGFFNKFLYLLTVIVLLRKGYLSASTAMFVMFYPSLLLYTSLALRDTIIMVSMLFSLLLMADRRYVVAILFAFPLYLVKPQNFVICVVFIALYMVAQPRNRPLSLRYVATLLAIPLAVGVAVFSVSIEEFNIMRLGMFMEDGGDPADIENFDDFNGILSESLMGGVNFLLRPFPWEVRNPFQFVQSFENLVILMLLGWWARSCWRISPQKTLFWLTFIGSSFALYGLIVFNFGAAARYRFPFVVTFAICMIYDCRRRVGYGQQNTLARTNMQVRETDKRILHGSVSN